MKRLFPFPIPFLFLLLLSPLCAVAQDAVRGRELYETHCLACHYERIHKRDPARSLIKSHAGLRVEVVNRATLTGRPFTVEDLDDIAEYLNRSHYKLQK
jgi:mono/diheme cytochrome c family protein